MNPVQQAIRDQIVLPALRQLWKSAKGTVRRAYVEENRFDVAVTDPNGPGTTLLERIPCALAGGGLKQAGPFENDTVQVEFRAGGPGGAVIVGIVDENYDSGTRALRQRHMRKGVLIPDTISTR